MCWKPSGTIKQRATIVCDTQIMTSALQPSNQDRTLFISQTWPTLSEYSHGRRAPLERVKPQTTAGTCNLHFPRTSIGKGAATMELYRHQHGTWNLTNIIAKHDDPRQARPHASTTIARVLKRAQLTSLTQVARTKLGHKSHAHRKGKKEHCISSGSNTARGTAGSHKARPTITHVLQCGDRTTLQHTALATHTHNSKHLIKQYPNSQLTTIVTHNTNFQGFETALTSTITMLYLQRVNSPKAIPQEIHREGHDHHGKRKGFDTALEI